jgi:hypothetical protein
MPPRILRKGYGGALASRIRDRRREPKPGEARSPIQAMRHEYWDGRREGLWKETKGDARDAVNRGHIVTALIDPILLLVEHGSLSPHLVFSNIAATSCRPGMNTLR